MIENKAIGYTQISSVTMNMTLNMEDGTTKTLSISEGDIISDLVFKSTICGCYKTITGRVKTINFKAKAGQTGTEICPHDTDSKFNDYFTPTSLTIDYSDEYTGAVEIIPLSAIKDFNDHVVKDEDVETGVSIVTDPDAVPENTILSVSVEFSEEEIKAIEKEVLKYDTEGSTYELYSIKLVNEETEIQPDGNVVVTVPLDEEKLSNCDYVEVRHILDETTNTYEILPCSIDKETNKLSFLVDKFSYFVIVYMKNPVYEIKSVEIHTNNKVGITANGGSILITSPTVEGKYAKVICNDTSIETDLNDVVVGGEEEKNIRNIDITMDGGFIVQIYGTPSHYVKDGEYLTCENVNITANSGEIYNAIVAGGMLAKTKNVNITVGGNCRIANVNAGGYAYNSVDKFSAGTADNPNGTIVENAEVTIKGDAKVAYVFGGPQSYGTTQNVVINVEDNANIIELVSGGSNGHTENVTVNVRGGKILQDLFTANRGTIKNATFNIYGGKIGCTKEELADSGIVFMGKPAKDMEAGCGIYLGNTQESGNATGKMTGKVTLNYYHPEVMPVYFGTGVEDCPVIELNSINSDLVVKMQTTSDKRINDPKEKLRPVGCDVKEIQTIYVNDNVTLEISEGMTVNNLGRIVTSGTGKVVVKGTLTGNEVEGNVEFVTSSTPEVTE